MCQFLRYSKGLLEGGIVFILGMAFFVDKKGCELRKEMMKNEFNATGILTLVIVIISAYVLMFSSIPFLYKIVIIGFSFILLLLVTLALQSLETIEKPRLQ